MNYIGLDDWDSPYWTNDIEVALLMIKRGFAVFDLTQKATLLDDGKLGEAVKEIKKEDLE